MSVSVEMTEERRQSLLIALQEACRKSPRGWITLRDFKRNKQRTFSSLEVDSHVTALHERGFITILKIGRSVRLMEGTAIRKTPSATEKDVYPERYKVIFVDAEYRNGVELEKQCEYWFSAYNAYELDNVVSLSISAAKKDIKGLLLFLRLRDDSESASLSEEKLDTEWWGN